MPTGRFTSKGSYISVHGAVGLDQDPSPAYLIVREAVRLVEAGTGLNLRQGVSLHSIQAMASFLGAYNEPREVSRAHVQDLVMIWEALSGRSDVRFAPRDRRAVISFIEQAQQILRRA